MADFFIKLNYFLFFFFSNDRSTKEPIIAMARPYAIITPKAFIAENTSVPSAVNVIPVTKLNITANSTSVNRPKIAPTKKCFSISLLYLSLFEIRFTISEIATLSCFIESRSRKVTVLSFNESKSTVIHQGVPISSCLL